MTPAKVFVIDDDAAVRESLRWLIESTDLAVETFASAGDFLARARPGAASATPGCIVTDVRMPGPSGLDLLSELARRAVTLPVVVITGHGDVPMAVKAMKLGAFDFVEKPIDDQHFLAIVQKAVSHSRLPAAARPKLAAAAVQVRERLERLSQRERQVLDLIVDGRPNKAVAHALNISEKTVEAHRAKIMDKMAARSFAALVRDVVTAGQAGAG
jgi:two-component system, LuxR family, response regulator FixJ